MFLLVLLASSRRKQSRVLDSDSDAENSVTITISGRAVARSVVGRPVSSHVVIRSAIGSRPPRSVAKKQKTSVNRESSVQYNRSAAGCRLTLTILASEGNSDTEYNTDTVIQYRLYLIQYE